MLGQVDNDLCEKDNNEIDIENFLKNGDLTVYNFNISKEIGTGKFGTIYLAQEKTTKFILALKVLHKTQLTTSNIDYHDEILNHTSANGHPNILKIYGHFEDLERVYILLEYASQGNIYKQFKQNPDYTFSEQKAATYIRDISLALLHCHSLGIVHRDIKPENILLTKDRVIKLCDFGWSAHIKPKEMLTLPCGTLDFLCPEIVNHEMYSYECDIWSLGILMYELIIGAPPFLEQTTKKTQIRIQNLDIKYPKTISKNAKNLLQKLLVINPQERLSLNNVIQHPWIIQNATHTSDYI